MTKSYTPETAILDEPYVRYERLNDEDTAVNAIAYAHDTNNTEAAMGMAIDGAAQTLKVHSDNIIDMRYHSTQRVSRASPGVNPSIISDDMQMACYLHEEKIEIQHEPGFWETFTGFFKEGYKKLRFIDRIVAGDYVDALQVAGECDDDCIKRDTPTCQNSFGISKKFISQDNAALFKLGSGSDLVNGYQEKPNIFQMADG
uniref:Uncharacterized protein n=1 Tax=Romanomermis culicivorax TaxID=13658 RepID=A0A915HJN8_ROMCU